MKNTKNSGRKKVLKSSACLSDEIAKLAYELYLHRGSQVGSDMQDWLKAEKMVISRCK